MTAESASRRPSKEDGSEGGGPKSDDGGPQAASKRMLGKLIHSKSDENEIQVLERLDHGINETAQDNKQVSKTHKIAFNS